MPDLDAAIRAKLAEISTRLDSDCMLQCGVSCADQGYRDVADAVLAVLDLHPQHPTVPGDCFQCDSRWPCRHLRTIAEALGISPTA